MSNNAHINDDEIEIHQLPEVSTLQAGMMVAVDSQPTGTKSFNLTTALEGKVDAPATTPEEGQVLTFNGSANTWANPPEGVYVLKYSEVTNLDDVDIDKATSIPTFILIDSKQILVIGNGSSGTTITVNAGTIMRLEEVGNPDDAGKPMLLTFVNDYGNSATGGTYMTYGNYFVRLVVSKSMYGGVSKKFGVSADIWSSNLFRSQQIPVVKKYDNARGPDESIGNLNGDANSLIVSFEDAGSNKRRQILPPAELASHDFATDDTPEQIQFMGWGATSNRAGYKNMLTASHGFDSTNYPTQTPTVNFTRYLMADPTSNYDANQVQMSAGITVKSSDGQNTQIWAGNFVPTPGANQGYLKYWTDTKGGHMDWTSVSEVPASAAGDSGKVLTVAANGTPGWGNAIGFIKNVGTLTDAATITASNLNNGFATLSTSQSALTIIDVVGTDEIVNFAIEITPSVNCTLTIKKKVGDSSPVTLKHSVAAGNTLEANKTYQVTAVGTCWTLAAFES